MRLDRYSGKPPKYEVLKGATAALDRVPHMIDLLNRSTADTPFRDMTLSLLEALRDARQPAADFFPMKRQDMNTGPALARYGDSALANGDPELASDIWRLRREWAEETARRLDAKRPD